MGGILNCPVKINLTLHILARRADGYHGLQSVFWSKTGNETLEVNFADCASLSVDGAKIDGKNILSSVLDFAGEKIPVPPLCLKLGKKYPQGSGIGAGSGNAAALLLWLRENCGLDFTAKEAARLGADVAVLTQESCLNYARGIGEELTPLGFGGIKTLHWLIAFPKWSSNTAAAYAKLDKKRTCRAADLDYFSEDITLLEKLSSHKETGLLPNDFLAVAMAEQAEYGEAFRTAENCGALAWGMCGSGSAMFFLSESVQTLKNISHELENKSWIQSFELLE